MYTEKHVLSKNIYKWNQNGLSLSWKDSENALTPHQRKSSGRSD